MNPFIKDPDAVLDYSIQWRNWLTDNDKIVSSEWLTPFPTTESPLEIVSGSEEHDGYTTTVKLSGGKKGYTYGVTNRITTEGGLVDDRTLTIQIKEK